MTGEQTPEDGDPFDDPFEQLTLDESFVASAGIAEPSAEQRAQAAARAEREQNLQRLLDDEALQRENRAQAHQRFAPDDDWDVWDDPDASPRRPGHGRTVRIVAVVVVLAMVVVYAISQFVVGRPPTVTGVPLPTAVAPGGSSAGSADGDATASGADPSVQVVRPDDWPAPPADVSSTPLGTPPAVPAGGGPHTFLRTQPDSVTPVSYDPCRPVHFVIRPGGPPEGEVLIREAVAAVSAATGLQFVHDGPTEEGPSDDRAPYQPERYGQRWAPVLFTWSDPVESPRLGEVTPEAPQADPAGYAGSIAVGYDAAGSNDAAGGEGSTAEMVYVTGSVTLDGPDLTTITEGPDGRARARAIIQHEVAHVVGLGHVEDQAQLMFPTVTPTVTGFNNGDLEGLAALGRGRCFPEI